MQRKSDIRVLFAKEAISTGWDCPRAEVIFSMRSHQDDTYIAQLIGRMVRTPLAESVNIQHMTETAGNNYMRPIIQSVSSLPIEELALLAETSLDKGTQRKTTENELPSLTQCTA